MRTQKKEDEAKASQGTGERRKAKECPGSETARRRSCSGGTSSKALYRFEGSARAFIRTLKTAQGRNETTNFKLFSFLNSLRKVRTDELARSSEQERRVDARALIADEGRDKLRKASGSRKWAMIRRSPNGGTRLG